VVHRRSQSVRGSEAAIADPASAGTNEGEPDEWTGETAGDTADERNLLCCLNAAVGCGWRVHSRYVVDGAAVLVRFAAGRVATLKRDRRVWRNVSRNEGGLGRGSADSTETGSWELCLTCLADDRDVVCGCIPQISDAVLQVAGVVLLDILPALKGEDSRPRWDIMVYDVACS